MKRDVVDYSPKWVGAVYFSTSIYGLKSKKLRQSRDFYSTLSATKNFKSIINDEPRKGCYKKYTTHVCVLVHVSKLLWINGKLGSGRKHQYWCN
jgi:hypothetical protein